MLRVLLAVLILLPGWSGEPRLPLYERDTQVRVRAVPLGPGGVTQAGRLTYLGGLHLYSSDPAFAGYSAMAVEGDRFTFVSDGGLTFDFRMGPGLRPYRPRFGELPGGPGRGWDKRERDSESLAVDPATGTRWVGFERYNMIWRYSPGFTRAEAGVAPAPMRHWPLNSGAEAMVRLRSGAFLVFSEGEGVAGGGWQALHFAGDPTRDPRHFVWALRTPSKYKPTDAAELPDGRLLVLTRRVAFPEGFTSKLLLVDDRAIRPGAKVTGAELATLAPPLIHDNFEGLAITREGDATIVWMISDDNGPSMFQRTLLLKFRIDLPPRARHKRERPASPDGEAGRSR